ncbi:MAG: hypothetical protein Q7J34_05370 [Bacteroidales bacterium]|nr:hypothetical protein [Bacteroidales bacterium]
MKKFFVLFIFLTVILFACSKDDKNPSSQLTKPKISSLISSKDTINYGGLEPAVLSVTASGGNLKYTWEVDLGDIIPENADATVVHFTGSSCCVGKKYIFCTVSNEMGVDVDTVVVVIREP